MWRHEQLRWLIDPPCEPIISVTMTILSLIANVKIEIKTQKKVFILHNSIIAAHADCCLHSFF